MDSTDRKHGNVAREPPVETYEASIGKDYETDDVSTGPILAVTRQSQTVKRSCTISNATNIGFTIASQKIPC